MSVKLVMRFWSARKLVKFQTCYRNLHQNDSNIINDQISGVTLSQIKQTLKLKRITTIEGHACISIECSICDSEKSNKAKIYINKTTGIYKIL